MMVNVNFMYVDSSSARPRKAKPCTEINGGVISGPAHVSDLFVFRLD
ncbi:hypothetical protein [Priestia aryabhattai]|nr:hypothetical protein [Priestia aryabhattai]